MAILKIKQPNGSWAIVGDTSETIKFTEQNLTNEQKQVARENIGASSIGKPGTALGSEIFNDYENNVADGVYSHAEGVDTEASEDYSHAEGESTWADGEASHAEGQSTMALGLASHSEGISTYTMGEGAHSEGIYSHADANYAHAEGNYCVAYAEASHAEGMSSETHASSAHAEGMFSMAMGQASHTEGRSTIAMGENAHAEGESSNLYDSAFETAADQQAFHTLWEENHCAIAYGQSSHVEGCDCMAYSAYAHAEGNETASMGYAAHTEGFGTIAFEDFSHVQGKFNKVTISDQYAHAVGNGESDSKRSNAHTLDWKGNAWFAGDVYVGSTSGTNEDEGSKKLATEEIVDTKVAAMGDTKMNALQNNATSYIIPAIPYGSNQPTYRILAAFASDIYSGRIPYYFNNTTEHSVPSNGWLITATPQYEGDCVNKKYVDDNFLPLVGNSTITGSLNITGDLHIAGTTYTEDAQTLRVADNIIELNSNKADNALTLSGIAINKNATATYGIMYDPTTDTVKFGEGETKSGVFSFGDEEGAPLAVRDDSSKIADGAIMIFDGSKNRLIDSGYTIDGFKQWVKDYIELYMSTTVVENEAGGETLDINTDNYTEENGTLIIGG